MKADAVLMIVNPDDEIMEVVGFPIDWSPPDIGFSGFTVPITNWGDTSRPGWRAVLELPNGCFEWELPSLIDGDTLAFEKGGREAQMRPCTKKGRVIANPVVPEVQEMIDAI